MWESVREGEAAREEAPDQAEVAEHLLPVLGELQEAADQEVPLAWPFSEAACAVNPPSRRYLGSSGSHHLARSAGYYWAVVLHWHSW